MKNVFKIPNLNPRKGFKPLRGLIVALLLPLVGSFSACSLADALKPTPQIDQYGLDKNAAFACLVNGQKWEPAGGTLFQPNLIADEDISNKQLAINAANTKNGDYQVANIIIKNFKSVANYENIGEGKTEIRFYDSNKYPFGTAGKIPVAFEGFVNITSFVQQRGSTSPKEVKGAFEFKTLDYKGDTLKITAGRFNINY